MSKRSKMIVLGTICAVLLMGTVNRINNKKNAEVTDIPSANIDKSNENISSESKDKIAIRNSEDTEEKSLLDTSLVDKTSTGNFNNEVMSNDINAYQKDDYQQVKN